MNSTTFDAFEALEAYATDLTTPGAYAVLVHRFTDPVRFGLHVVTPPTGKNTRNPDRPHHRTVDLFDTEATWALSKEMDRLGRFTDVLDWMDLTDQQRQFIRDQIIPLEWKSCTDEQLADLIDVRNYAGPHDKNLAPSEDINVLMERVRTAAAADDAAESAGRLLASGEDKVMAARGWVEGAKATVKVIYGDIAKDQEEVKLVSDLITAHLWDVSFGLERIHEGTGTWEDVLVTVQTTVHSRLETCRAIANALLAFLAEEN